MKKKKIILGSLFALILVAIITCIALFTTWFKDAYYNVLSITVSADDDDFDALRDKYLVSLTGGDEYDLTDVNIQKNIEEIDENANKSWSTMNKGDDIVTLWDSLPYGDDVRDNDMSIMNSYNNIFAMATAYGTYGSTLEGNEDLKNDIIYGMEWLYTNKFNEKSPLYNKVGGQGFYKVMGIPRAIVKITTIMYDDFSQDQIDRYIKTVDHFCPDPTFWIWEPSTGANRSCQSEIVIVRGILGKDKSKIIQGRNAMNDVYEYVTDGDGFYEDGSFIQHKAVAYTAGYGGNLLKDTVFIRYLLADSPFEITNPKADNVYEWVFNAFEPITYESYTFDDARGREMSRVGSKNYSVTSKIAQSIVLLSQVPSQYQDRVQSLAKYYLINTPEYFTLQTNWDIVMGQKILDDDEIVPRSGLNLYKQYPSMDFVVLQRPDYALGVSMHSTRTFNYEIVNDENLKGWHQGDGWLQLVDEDYASYDDAYWPTMNSFRYPGTTVIKDSIYDEVTYNGSPWVGGTDIDGLYGVTGMEFAPTVLDLDAKKSWFMFDDEIVCLGTGITSNSGEPVETVVESKMINENGDNDLIIDGQLMPSDLGWTQTYSGINNIFIENNSSNKGTGYYFPTDQNLTALRETREGAWDDINQYIALNVGIDTKEVFARNYLTLVLDHGTDPQGEDYEYVLLPSKTSDEVMEYSNSPDIEVIANNDDVQAVRENNLNIISANFWNDTEATADIITSQDQASVMVKEDENGYEISVSDPTQLNQDKIELEILGSGSQVTSCDDEVKVIQTSPTIKLEVNVKDSMGKTFRANISK